MADERNKIRVFILSKPSLFRQGLEQCLSAAEDIEISGAIEISDEVLSNLENNLPDVAIVDMIVLMIMG
jgi:DNA-binding NarL/FixJ family response regulator